MQITVKKTTEETRDIPVPSFWKNEYSFYRLYEKDGDTMCEAVHDWHVLNKLDFSSNYPANIINLDTAKQITAKEFEEVLNKIVHKIEDILDAIDPQKDATWVLSKTLVPTKEPENG